MPATRDPWFDNAKMALMTLVVLGHAWSIWLPATPANSWAYDFLYVWHMPAFVLLSGYFSRSFDWTSRRLKLLVGSLVVPFVLYQVLLVLFQVEIGWGTPEHPFLEPLWPLWYLVALVAWRLVAPVFRMVPPHVAVAAAVGVSLLGGTVDTPYLGLSKVLGMLPFFVIGLVATREHVERLRSPQVQLLGIGALLSTLWWVRHLDSGTTIYWLLHRPYALIGVSDTEGVVTRAVVLTVSLVCALAALSLVPGREGTWTRMGTATMTVLLGHAFVVRGAEARGLFDWTDTHESLGRVVVVAVAVGLSAFLASQRVERCLAPVTDPVGWWRARRSTTPAVDRERVSQPATR
ncbi:acyltransferase family protein [Nocardioides sp. C4-1]|uniref:acyltransferase family protein n=1 Tax=Nocardioides sp. C4-1 TaxID=3151851 RepID=UPI003267E65F